MPRLKPVALFRLFDGKPCRAAEDLGQPARKIRGKMLDQDDRRREIFWKSGEDHAEGVEAAGGGSNGNDAACTADRVTHRVT